MASISLAAASGDCRFLQGAACCWGHAAHFALILSTPIQFSTVTNLGLVSRPPDFKSVFKLCASSRPSFLHAVKLRGGQECARLMAPFFFNITCQTYFCMIASQTKQLTQQHILSSQYLQIGHAQNLILVLAQPRARVSSVIGREACN